MLRPPRLQSQLSRKHILAGGPCPYHGPRIQTAIRQSETAIEQLNRRTAALDQALNGPGRREQSRRILAQKEGESSWFPAKPWKRSSASIPSLELDISGPEGRVGEARHRRENAGHPEPGERIAAEIQEQTAESRSGEPPSEFYSDHGGSDPPGPVSRRSWSTFGARNRRSRAGSPK